MKNLTKSEIKKAEEKLINYGTQSLNDKQVIAMLAPRNASKTILSNEPDILKMANENYHELIGRGFSHREAIVLACSYELGRRRFRVVKNKYQVKSSIDVVRYFAEYYNDLTEEHFAIMYLNRKNEVIKHSVLFKGGIHGVVCDVRVIAREAIILRASSIICVHNHPSGGDQPSQSDIDISKKIKNAMELIEIKMLDSVIFAGLRDASVVFGRTNPELHFNYYSFADNGLI